MEGASILKSRHIWRPARVRICQSKGEQTGTPPSPGSQPARAKWPYHGWGLVSGMLVVGIAGRSTSWRHGQLSPLLLHHLAEHSCAAQSKGTEAKHSQKLRASPHWHLLPGPAPHVLCSLPGITGSPSATTIWEINLDGEDEMVQAPL